MKQLRDKVNEQSTETILKCLEIIGGGMNVTSEERMARAALIQVYEERTSAEDADAIMDAMGM